MDTGKFVARLTDEWLRYGKIIIAVDFDDTLKPWSDIVSQQDCDEVIALLIECKKSGAYVVVNTACNPDRFEEIRGYCSSKGLQVDKINANPINLPYGTHGKVYANIYLDDRGDLVGSIKILQRALYGVRGVRSYEGLNDVA